MRRLPLLVGAIVLVDTMFFAAIAPLLPELARELSLGKNGAGLLSAAYAVGALAGALPAGALIARVGPKPTVLVGQALMVPAGVAFAFGTTVEVLDAARFLQGIGSACSWAAGLTWLATGVSRDRRGAVLGGALGAAIVGAQLGPVVGALATVIGQELAFCLMAAFGVALAAWAMAIPSPDDMADALATPAQALRSRAVLAGIWLTALPATAGGLVGVLAPLRLDELGATGVAIGVAFFVAAGVEAIVAPRAGRVTDRRGAMPVARVGLVAGAVALALLPLPASTWLLAGTIVASGAALGVLWVPAMALLTGGAERIGLDPGFAFAFFNLAWSGGFMVGAGAGSALADATSDAIPYLILAAASAATIPVVSARQRRYV